MASISPIPISSILDIIKWNLLNTGSEDKVVRYVFRGVTKTEYKLFPKICRQKDFSIIKNPQHRINLLQDYLKIHLPAYGHEFHNDDQKIRQWKEIFIAQHYGVMTHLLDFTRNPLVAAFFAAYKNPKSDGKIYAIRIQEQNWKKNIFKPRNEDYNIVSYHLLASKEPENFNGWSPYDLERSLFVVPSIIDKRIQAQIGVFCCFSLKSSVKPLNEQKGFYNKSVDEAGHIQEFTIKGEQKEKILKELNKIGINHMSLFPDLGGFGDFVSWKLEGYDCKS